MNHGGTSLIELLCLLAVIGVGLALFGPALSRQVDHLAARAAREEFIALLSRARSEARLRGAAELRVSEGSDPGLWVGDDRRIRRLDLGARRVRLDVAGARSEVVLRFGPMGLAKWGSATFILHRRNASAEVVVSSYGRVRR